MFNHQIEDGIPLMLVSTKDLRYGTSLAIPYEDH